MSKVRSMLASRDGLVLEHLALVDTIARHLHAKFPPCFELDDLVSAGRLGLIKAAALFDKTRGVSFEAYARKRIRGEILEAVGFHSTREHCRRWRFEEATRPPIKEHDVDAPRDQVRGESADPDVDLDRDVEAAKRRELIDGAIASLPRRHAVLIEMHYRGDLPMSDVAASPEFSVSRGRASQIHKEAKQMVGEYLRRRGFRLAA